jgi:hypothetical protein
MGSSDMVASRPHHESSGTAYLVISNIVCNGTVDDSLQPVEPPRQRFSRLAERWRRETRFLSSADEKILHEAYQSIIAMGGEGVPFVLEELEKRRGHWFWALRFMAGVNPVPDGANIDGARDAWIVWGKANGYLK